MKKLRLRTQEERDEYYHDVLKIIEACASQGYEIDFASAKAAWLEYSDSMCAGWMGIGDDPYYTYLYIAPYLVEED